MGLSKMVYASSWLVSLLKMAIIGWKVGSTICGQTHVLMYPAVGVLFVRRYLRLGHPFYGSMAMICTSVRSLFVTINE